MQFSGKLSEILKYHLLNNSISQIGIAITSYILLFFVLKQLLKFGIQRIQTYTKGKKENFGILLLEIIQSIPSYFFITLQIYIPLKILNIPSLLDKILDGVLFLIIILEIIRVGNTLLIYIIKHSSGKKGRMQKTTQKALQLIVKIVVWTIGSLVLLSNLGIEITPLIASLGVGGIAVAFALQNVLQDMFASFSIFISTPFKIGNYVKIDDNISGTVKDISFKSTHIITTQGYDIRIPNKDIINNPLENYSNMKERRIRFNIGIVYETPHKTIEKIPSLIQKIIEQEENIIYEWTRLEKLGTFSIDFKISYLITNPDYLYYLEKNHNILLNILKCFEKNNIQLAYPTQTIYSK